MVCFVGVAIKQLNMCRKFTLNINSYIWDEDNIMYSIGGLVSYEIPSLCCSPPAQFFLSRSFSVQHVKYVNILYHITVLWSSAVWVKAVMSFIFLGKWYKITSRLIWAETPIEFVQTKHLARLSTFACWYITLIALCATCTSPFLFNSSIHQSTQHNYVNSLLGGFIECNLTSPYAPILFLK